MTDYTHILVTVDDSDDALKVARRGLELARRLDAKLSLLHVVDQRALLAGGEADVPLFGMKGGEAAGELRTTLTDPQPAPFSTDDRLLVRANDFLRSLAGQLEIPDIDTHVAASSSIARQVALTAVRLGVDLLVCGAHHRHGLALFLPSPVDGIIHHLPCDVLLVRLPT
jgi:universal stress protein A